jgi:hypothetical protein
MKKVFLFVSLVLFLPSGLLAAPCYGTKMPQRGKFFGGFETHTIFKRNLEADYGKVRSTQHFFQLSYGIYHWLSLDLKGGAGNIKQHPLSSDEVDYTSSFAGGYGIRLKFCDREKIKMVLGFQHISVHPRTIRLGEVRHKSVLDDWLLSLLASYDFNRVTPYLGTKLSRVDYIHWIEEDRKRRKSDLTKSVGLVCGFDINLTPKTWLNLEGQFLDGEALSCSFNFKF